MKPFTRNALSFTFAACAIPLYVVLDSATLSFCSIIASLTCLAAKRENAHTTNRPKLTR